MTPRLNFGWLPLKRGLLCFGMVLTLAVTIFTDTSSIVERRVLVSILQSRALCSHWFLCSCLPFRPCRFQSSLPLPCCGHRRIAAGVAETLSHLYQPSELRCTCWFVFCAATSFVASIARLELLRLLVSAAKDLTFPTVLSMLVKQHVFSSSSSSACKHCTINSRSFATVVRLS